MTNEQLTEIETRLNAATPGPWAIYQRIILPSEMGAKLSDPMEPKIVRSIVTGWEHGQLRAHMPITQTWSTPFLTESVFFDIREENAELIAQAPTDIAALIAEVRKLQAEAQDAFVDGLSIPE